jgi:hypothetical protein
MAGQGGKRKWFTSNRPEQLREMKPILFKAWSLACLFWARRAQIKYFGPSVALRARQKKEGAMIWKG